jgi:hypothetical protein
VTYDSGGSQASMVTIADLNADARPDVVAVNCGGCCVVRQPGSIAVMLGNGDGTFQPAVAYDPGGMTPLFVAVADVNHDAAQDLLVANRCGNGGCLNDARVGVLLNRGHRQQLRRPRLQRIGRRASRPWRWDVRVCNHLPHRNRRRRRVNSRRRQY